MLIVSSCMTTSELSKRQLKNIDKTLVGTWIGSETGIQFKNTKREWEMIRNEDGTFILKFKTHNSDYISESTEEGIWWTKNGKFYEHHTGYKTDVYEYEVQNENEIKFKSIKIRTYCESDTYEFIDKRKIN